MELGAAYLSRLDEVQEFYKYCEQAPTLSGETVRIAMLDGDHVIYLARYEGHPAVRLTSNIGDKMPVSLCSVGKALIAQLHDHDIDAMFPDGMELPTMTANSLKTAEELKAQISTIRKQGGYAFEDEESTVGVVCLAVPVPTHGGAHGPSLGLSVTALKATYSEEQGASWSRNLRNWRVPWVTPWVSSFQTLEINLITTLAARSTSCTLFIIVILAVMPSLSRWANGGGPGG